MSGPQASHVFGLPVIVLAGVGQYSVSQREYDDSHVRRCVICFLFFQFLSGVYNHIGIKLS